MRYLLLAFVLLGAGARAQIIKKNYFPNTVPIQDMYLCMATDEVSNREYRAFLSHMGNKAADYMPDSSGWGRYIMEDMFLRDNYFRQPEFNDCPVTNITWHQAAAYCRFLEEEITLTEAFKKSPIAKIRVRLPSESEWIQAAKGHNPDALYPWEGEDLVIVKGRYKGRPKANMKMGENNSGTENTEVFIDETLTNVPNSLGIFNMAGNVAEWTEEQNHARGGSFLQPPYNARLDVPGLVYADSDSRPDIGFRYVIEITELKIPAQNKCYTLTAREVEDLAGYTPKAPYTAYTETPNWLYRLFLEDADSSFRPQSEQWLTLLRYPFFKTYDWHPYFDEYPVVNISYGSAVKFCEWLTAKYNNMPKRKYKKVVFRLPSEMEWVTAASAGKDIRYPWTGSYTRNARGCYLANFFPMDQKYLVNDTAGQHYQYPANDSTVSRGMDGAVIPVKVYRYFPNDYGLYNCAGNVAEMIQGGAITKGGSWNSHEPYIQVSAVESYKGPSPTTGFRYVMEIVEE